MLKDTADTWSYGDVILTRTMKLPDLFTVISANFQLSQKSNNVVTFFSLAFRNPLNRYSTSSLRTQSEDYKKVMLKVLDGFYHP
jgi:hypothetical protein